MIANDETASATSQVHGGSSHTFNISTSGTNEIVCLFAALISLDAGDFPSVTSITGGGLTWKQRSYAEWNGSEGPFGPCGLTLSMWYAFAADALTDEPITVNYAATEFDAGAFGVCGITGLFDPSGSTFDSNTGLPNIQQSAGPDFELTNFSTDEADDYLIMVVTNPESSGGGAAIPDWTTWINFANGSGNNYVLLRMFFQIVSAKQVAQTYTDGTQSGAAGLVIGDALTADNNVIITIFKPQPPILPPVNGPANIRTNPVPLFKGGMGVDPPEPSLGLHPKLTWT